MPERRIPAGLTPRCLSIDEAAAYCGVVRETFEKHIRPSVPPIDIGRRVLWDIRALDRWLDGRSGIGAQSRPVEGWLAGLGRHAGARKGD